MKIFLKRFSNTLTVVATLLLVFGMGYVLVKELPIGDFISEISFCYIAIAVFNYMVFGTATLWHKKDEV